MNKIYSHTQSLCNTCKSKIPARIIQKNNAVYLEKHCPEHGFAEALISSDIEWYEQSRTFVKPGQIPLRYNTKEFKGCPESCGSCSEHQQHTCLPVIEINRNCNLACPICLKGENVNESMSLQDFEGVIDNLFVTEGTVDVINISGGEPTLHPQFEEFLALACKKGIVQISVSTNGLELLTNSKLRAIFKKYEAIVALQFDGFNSEAYIAIRGLDLLQKKLELIELLEKEQIHYSLVSTIVNGINNNEVKKITDFFFTSNALTLMFQPIAFSGYADTFNPITNRITVPDIITNIEKSEFVKKGDFNPLPCSHYSCFALAYYLKVDNTQYYSLKEFLGESSFLDLIANKTLPGLDTEGYSQMKHRLYEFWSASDSANLNEKVMERIKGIVKEMSCCGFNQTNALKLGKTHMKAIFIHQFMDVYNFDFSRLVKCCNPYAQPNNKLVSMCAQNVIFV